MSSPNTPQADILTVIATLRETFNSKATLPYSWRIKQLETLLELVNDEALSIALYNDLHRSKFESDLLELDLIKDEITTAINNLDSWMRPQARSTNLANIPGSSKIKHDPLGVALIMSPWNYPLLLTFQPLVGAFAAGNTALLRPANYSDNVSMTILQLIDKYFNQGLGENTITPTTTTTTTTTTTAQFVKGLPVYVVLGDRVVTDFVLNQQFDYIFFTGGPHLGKIVLSKASKFLTPCTIELGGKSPCIVDKDCGDLDVVAKRLVWSTFLNSGQTCVRPDYGLVHAAVLPKLLPLMRKYILEFYGGYGPDVASASGDEIEYHTMAINALIASGNRNNNGNEPSSPKMSGGNENDSLLKNRNGQAQPQTSSSAQETTTTTTDQNSLNSKTLSLPSFDSLLQPTLVTTAVDVNYGSFEDAGVKDGDNKDLANDNLSLFRAIAHSPYFGRIINKANFNRLVNCIKTDNQYVYCGGIIDPATSFIAPTILNFGTNYQAFSASESMKEELFGPIFPIFAFEDLDTAVNHIRANPKPLAAYCFTTSSKTTDIITNHTSSGSLVFNDCIVQLSNHDLPFGGVGFSGFGMYHGLASFQTFSHQKAVLTKTTWFDIFARYPPYSHVKRRVFGGLHCIEGCGTKVGRAWSGVRRVWCDKLPGLVQFIIIIAILAGVGCGLYFLYPQWMKLMKMWVESHYGAKCL